ncbi:hypothetical protein HZA97_08160 [Candidatus Woesearchaeota archaeon]|nr:hypothetical protein [Candidatus Woesearchaeota archaeon]
MKKEFDLLVSQLRKMGDQYKNDKDFVEPIHKKLVHDLDVFMEYPIKKNEVIPISFFDFPEVFAIMGGIDSSFFIPNHNIIGLNLLSIRCAGAIEDEKGNIVDEADTHDLYSILAHEYFHSIFFDYHHARLVELLKEKPPQNFLSFDEGPKVRGINEAFAFWGQKAITGEDFLGKKDLQTYLITYEQNGTDIKALKQTYELLNKYEKTHGKSYAANNLLKIVNDNLLTSD